VFLFRRGRKAARLRGCFACFVQQLPRGASGHSDRLGRHAEGGDMKQIPVGDGVVEVWRHGGLFLGLLEPLELSERAQALALAVVYFHVRAYQASHPQTWWPITFSVTEDYIDVDTLDREQAKCLLENLLDVIEMPDLREAA